MNGSAFFPLLQRLGTEGGTAKSLRRLHLDGSVCFISEPYEVELMARAAYYFNKDTTEGTAFHALFIYSAGKSSLVDVYKVYTEFDTEVIPSFLLYVGEVAGPAKFVPSCQIVVFHQNALGRLQPYELDSELRRQCKEALESTSFPKAKTIQAQKSFFLAPFLPSQRKHSQGRPR